MVDHVACFLGKSSFGWNASEKCAFRNRFLSYYRAGQPRLNHAFDARVMHLPMTNRVLILATVLATAVLGLSSCSRDKAPTVVGQGADPLLAHALAGPVMTDPDLASRNRALAGIAGGGPEVIELPLFENSAQIIAAAKIEAQQILGGTVAVAPSPGNAFNLVLRDAVTAAQRAAVVTGPGNNCGAKASYDMGWSLRLPPPFQIYPRGHLIEAAGNDGEDCRLRVVRFVTPVDPAAVIDFYFTLTRDAHFRTRHEQAKGAEQLQGSKGAAMYAVQARLREDGLTEADIVVNGL
jgi:hypothetical protein